METLSITFDRKVSDVLMDAYWVALSRLSDAQFQTAVERHMVTGRFFPKPSELLEDILGTPGDQVAIAWARVRLAIRDHGHSSSVDFGDPRIHVAVRAMGGWVGICSKTVRELDYSGREFAALYGSASPEGAPAYLPGAFVGDPVKVKQIGGLDAPLMIEEGK